MTGHGKRKKVIPLDARNYLRQIHKLETRISMRQRQIKDLRRSMSYLKSMDYSADRVQTSASGTGFTAEAIRLADLEMDAERQIKECEALRARIVSQIEGLEDPRFVDVLSGVYIHRLDLMDIADNMHYDYYWVCHLHGEALAAFTEKYLDDRNQPQDGANST